MSLLGRAHASLIHSRRVDVLSRHLSALLPEAGEALDVGCGDGWLAAMLVARRPDVRIRGIDVLQRAAAHIPVSTFDGIRIPFPDQSFDSVLFVDVLHHTSDPMVLLREGARVARRSILIKDHTRDGVLASSTLRLMDWVGNARHGVALPYNYWTSRQWHEAVQDLGLRSTVWETDLGLYPAPVNWICGRSLHFVAALTPA